MEGGCGCEGVAGGGEQDVTKAESRLGRKERKLWQSKRITMLLRHNGGLDWKADAEVAKGKKKD